MKHEVWFVFEDWKNIPENKSVYNTELGVELSMGNLHSGSMFKGTIDIEDDEWEDILHALPKDVSPVFYLHIDR